MCMWESEMKDKGRIIDYRAMLQQQHEIMGGCSFSLTLEIRENAKPVRRP